MLCHLNNFHDVQRKKKFVLENEAKGLFYGKSFRRPRSISHKKTCQIDQLLLPEAITQIKKKQIHVIRLFL
jgi:hypothetical protein